MIHFDFFNIHKFLSNIYRKKNLKNSIHSRIFKSLKIARAQPLQFSTYLEKFLCSGRKNLKREE